MAERRSQAPDTVSWFGPHQDSGWDAGIEASDGDPHFFDRRAAAGSTTFQRMLRAFLGARAALGLALVAALLLGHVLGTEASKPVLTLCAAYALVAVLTWWLIGFRARPRPRQLASPVHLLWWSSVGLDLLSFGLLNALDANAGVGFSALFIMPVLMAGVLSPRRMALATAAAASLLLLGHAGWLVWAGHDSGIRFSQLGLVSSGFFVIGLLASELAGRLAREERAARGSLEFARQQAELNRLVIDEMQEGVLVVDRRGRVRAANPAAQALLAHGQHAPAAPFQLRSVPAWSGLVVAVEEAFSRGGWPEGGQDVTLAFDGSPRSLRVRMRFTRRRESSAEEDLCVLLLEDNRKVLARNRQEKLAAMGRVSAGIAHEIRNPLAAIDQANALLSEDLPDPRSQQLTRMVASNVQRLKRIVDDVMEVAPGLVPAPVAFDAASLVRACCEDWARTNQLPMGTDGPLKMDLPSQPVMVLFEPEHLRRVLVNLLDNALRHAPPGVDTVRVRLDAHPGDGERPVLLSVFSLGEPIPAEIERHLFEPFFSTRSRGSGLGLYICRELCEHYGARIDYRSHRGGERGGNEFRVQLRRPDAAEGALPADLFSSPA